MIRFAPRSVQHSFVEALRAFLTDAGWMGDAPRPFGAGALGVHERAPQRNDLVPTDGNTIYVSFGDEPADRPLQLGGGLYRSEYVFFVDIVAENETIGLVLADDIKQRLAGRRGGSRFLRPVDMVTGSPMADYAVEITDVARSQPDGERRTWYTVDGTLLVDYVAEEG